MNDYIDKETRKSVSSLDIKLGRTLLTRSSKTQRNVTLSSKETEYMELSTWVQEIKFVCMLLREMTEVQNPYVIYKYNKGAMFLANNSQLGICTKHIYIHHYFLRDMLKKTGY